ncbi:hypothetical protein DM02DRAFT_287455 [Periconia macrospinosa]|uniref:SUN domain-containing protein n=1 Tax=Periconia macrospinosa TaxID=97972 RepID=A0A2V1EAZ0_9PLEO|nr:hypothetical protein DM02DRAFT_287455 [Periconia macrospinosa]
MLTIGAPLYEWVGCLLPLCSLLTCTLAQSTNKTASADTARLLSSIVPTTTGPKSGPASASFADYTCPARTINYITHTLPQQCLRTGWPAAGHPSGTEAIGDGKTAASSDEAVPWPNESVLEGAPAPEQDIQTSTTEQVASVTTSLTTTPGVTTDTQADAELETDSPLDNANFLSFEEWKRRNLVEAGQSPDSLGQGRVKADDQGRRRRPVNVNALDSLGEEGEIDLNFSGFGSPEQEDAASSSGAPNQENMGEAASTANGADKAAPSSWALSKDAGKTYNERFNYASFDCAATVLKTNPKAKSTSSILVENKDSYMLTECAADNKYIIVELCDDILVDTVVLANYEFFSSMFRHFRISASDRYPVKVDRWRVLGTFEARNSRDIQPFLIKEPQIWARYLRIEFLTHYGNEYYCPMSLLRVHGTTMIEQFRREEEQARGEDDADEAIEAVAVEPVHSAVTYTENDTKSSVEQTSVEDEQKNMSYIAVQESYSASIANITSQSQFSDNSDAAGPQPSWVQKRPEKASEASSSGRLIDDPEQSVSNDDEQFTQVKSTSVHAGQSVVPGSSQNATNSGTLVDSSKDASPSSQIMSTPNLNSPSTISTRTTDVKPTATEPSSIASNVLSTKTGFESVKDGSQTQISSHKPAQTQPNPATPSTQESVFKSIHKRLQYLEANSTLSLQYIEEQSRILRDAFIKVEKKQLQKTENFLDHLNSTVMQELKTYRNMYDQLWQSTILELEGMKERQKIEVGEIGARLSMMADELVWQKRMAVVQSTLLLLCLGLVLFVRSGTLNPQPDVPIAQQLGRTYSSFFETPPHEREHPKASRHRKRFRDMWRSDTSVALSDRSGQLSDAVNAASDADTYGRRRSGVNMDYSPRTPVTPGIASDVDKEVGFSREAIKVFTNDDQDGGLLTPTEDAEEHNKRLRALETQSGPATPRGSRDNRPSWEEVDRAVGRLKAEEKHQGVEAQGAIGGRRKPKRSPLGRAESYDGRRSDSPEDDVNEDYFIT